MTALCWCCTKRRTPRRRAHDDEPPRRRRPESRRATDAPSRPRAERPLRERTVNTLPQRLSRVRALADRGARVGRWKARCREARRGHPQPGDVHPPGAGLAADPGARGVDAVGLPVPTRRADRRPAAALLRDDRGRVSQGRGRQEHGHRAAGIAIGVPAPRPGGGRGDQPGLGVARPTASTRPPDLHRRPARRTAERRTECRRQVWTRSWAAAQTG